MSSFFRSKRISSESKSSSSKSAAESDPPKPPKSSGSAPPSSKPRTAMPVAAPAGPAPSASSSSSNSKQSNSRLGKTERSMSVDTAVWADTDRSTDGRAMPSTVTDKTVSISRSGRYKAKGKARARLFSDEAVDGSADNPEADRRGAATTLSSPEDRQTVLQAMAMRSEAAKWSTHPTSMDL